MSNKNNYKIGETVHLKYPDSDKLGIVIGTEYIKAGKQVDFVLCYEVRDGLNRTGMYTTNTMFPSKTQLIQNITNLSREDIKETSNNFFSETQEQKIRKLEKELL